MLRLTTKKNKDQIRKRIQDHPTDEHLRGFFLCFVLVSKSCLFQTDNGEIERYSLPYL